MGDILNNMIQASFDECSFNRRSRLVRGVVASHAFVIAFGEVSVWGHLELRLRSRFTRSRLNRCVNNLDTLLMRSNHWVFRSVSTKFGEREHI